MENKTRLQVVRDRIVARQNSERKERETRREKYLSNHNKVLAFLKEHIPELGDGDTGEISPIGLYETTFRIKDKFDGYAVLYVGTNFGNTDERRATWAQTARRDEYNASSRGEVYYIDDIVEYIPGPGHFPTSAELIIHELARLLEEP